MRKRLVLAVVAMSLLLVAGRASAQTDLDRARSDVTSATERLEGLLDELETTQRRGDELAGEYWQVQSGVQKLDLDIEANEGEAEAIAAQVEGLREEVRVIAVERYMTNSDSIGTVDHESEADRAAAETLARLVVGIDNSAIDQLGLTESRYQDVLDELAAQRQAQLEALASVEQTQEGIQRELARLSELEAEVAEELAELEGALAELEAAEAARQAEAAAAVERERLAEERARAEAAAAAAAERARAVPTPAPTATSTPIPPPAALAETETEPTPVPNPQPSEPFPTATVESGAETEPTPVPEPTVPNPQPSEPFPTATVESGAETEPTPVPEPTVPNPQPSEPLPTPTAVATAVPNPQPSIPSGGGIVCPLSGSFTHTDDFSAPRAVGGIHRANDLIAATGTPVIAVASGTVEHRNSSVGGMSAHLKGDNGDYYFYTHLSGYENVGAGHVSAGTVIGYVGMTGNAPIPHLHFEIHSGGYGNYTNPYGPVRTACFG